MIGLRAFHILFILLSVIVSLGFAAWSRGRGDVRMSGAALVLGVLLAVYGTWFVLKTVKGKK